MDFQLLITIGVAILMIFNSYQKRKRQAETENKDTGDCDYETEMESTPKKKVEHPMTWEEMEKNYGIKIQRKEEIEEVEKIEKIEKIEQPDDIQWGSSNGVTKTEKVTTKSVAASLRVVVPKASLQRAARNGIIWAELMEKPLALRKRR